MHILLIEDDPVLTDGLLHTLTASHYQVTAANTGAYAKHLLLAHEFDLIIMDLGLPDIDGLDLLRSFRRLKISMPILVLTARDGINDKITGIEQGADDYLTKPFELRELEARIKALIRRCYGGFNHHLVFGGLVFDTQNHRLTCGEQLIILSPREYEVLEVLFLQAGKVVSKERIAQRLAVDGDALTDNAVEIYIHRLRKHLESYAILIRTVRGLGYLLEKSPDA